ncbi:hypothetical protein [Metapseudomonas resinovorans]|uniref:Lipoprotein n=1 Tax=Metapseudomonas resinovorans NBRC 106553 TaxID=1245471 RepID=S6AIA9_METRE|nr:hypothetical protein [Pseudomonas resinovorans]BAN50382.1 hypothetical protein PCA10_46500 [Pseudomonas resinovorans NBRC 106553]
MKYACLLLSLLVLAGCKSLTGLNLEDDYRGDDVGHVVIGLGGTAGAQYYSVALYYKRSMFNAGKLDELSRFVYPPLFELVSKPDYVTEQEEGRVLTAKLAPGEYEFVNFHATIYNQVVYSAGAPFSIPFTVRAGETTYLGNYRAVASEGQGPMGGVKGTPLFLLQDEAERDLALARKREPGLFKTVQNATPKAAWIKREFFVDELPTEVVQKQRGRMSMQEMLWGG